MILLFFALAGFSFLVLGSIVFVLCIAIPVLRKYALSSALWCAAWGPCLIVWMIVAGLGIVAGALTVKHGRFPVFEMPQFQALLGWSYVAAAVCTTAIVATGLAWVHQMLIHRLMFMLFRLYATTVSAGIGSVFGWCLCWWLIARPAAPYALWFCPFALLVPVAVFGAEAYKKAHGLRGRAPTRFTWITADEFAGRSRP